MDVRSVALVVGAAVALAGGAAVLGAEVGEGVPGPDQGPSGATGPLVGGGGPPDGRGPAPPRAGASLRPAGAFRSPTGSAPEVLREFDAPDRPWTAGHRGADLVLAAGAPVLAAGDGVVAFAGTVVDRPVVSVLHTDGLRTTYEPVTPAVRRGDRVHAGAVLGHLAVPGHCDPRSCLHWGARRGPSAYLDPLSLLRPVIRLLPG
ncbi:M23 family metallopeptidase [Georgenia sp. 10Sc9-8]|uniref:M23 family metallopeptidase n=1 Tax=Georgenia halotolerans TaxID=3028317 RepID=A0ABT5TVV7_9MICO|nr:M23 family metallopeptidase [Georgenia halotolerans]